MPIYFGPTTSGVAVAIFKWNESLSVKVVAFDLHHRKLIDIMNELHDFMLNGRPQDIIENTLADLLSYTQYHFENEEKAMSAHGFAGYDEHRAEHDRFVAKIRELMSKYKTTPLPVAIDLMDFLREWLTGHIIKTDKQYSDFLASKGVR